MINSLKEAFHTLIDEGNIGKKDIERLEILLDNLDKEGKLSKVDAITITHPKSKNAERSYDNFINRIKKEIKEFYTETDNEEYREILASLSISHTHLLGISYLVLKGKSIVKLQPTTSLNKTYNKKYYINSAGDTSRKKEIFISYSVENEGEKERFITHLKHVLDKKKITYHLDLWEMKEIPIGISFDKVIKEHLKKADYGFILLSNNIMKSNYILDVELSYLLESDKVFPIGLVGSIDELMDAKQKIRKRKQKKIADELMSRNILLSKEHTFFNKCINDKRREEFIEDVFSSLEHRIIFDKKVSNIELNCVLADKEGYNDKDFFSQHKGQPTNIETVTQKHNVKPQALAVKIQDDLQQWLNNEKKALYALLGDYGMGKTFNLRMFSHKLYDIYMKDKNKPFPFYIDLRDVESFVTTSDGIKRVRTLEEYINEILRQSKNTHITSEEILKMHQNGSLILILDGLDEKLVHYNKEQQSIFFREIISVMTYQLEGHHASKTILSCRNHYFESTAKQNNFLLGSDRTNLKNNDYTALNILPLDEKDIKSFLLKRITTEETERIMLYISSDEYLGNIASRPFMLGKIIELLPALTQLKTKQKPINTATFYSALIQDTLARDEEKHFIEERHKHTILKALSHYMFDNNTQSLSVDRLNNWFEDFIDASPKLARRYSLREDGHILEKDLRNSSLLVRFGDEYFGFSHSSIAEYFLAQYILEHYQTASTGKEVSSLTHTIILETVEGYSKENKQILFPKVMSCVQGSDSYWAKLSMELLCKLQLQMDKLEIHHLDLQNFQFKNLIINKLSLTDCNLSGASWEQCYIKKFNIKDTNLSENYFSHSKIEELDYSNSRTYPLTSYKSKIDINLTHNYDTPSNHPFPFTVSTQLSYSICCIAYSPDGTKLLSGSSDNTLRLWDIKNEKCLLTLDGHTNWVTSVAYSPDGTKLLSGSSDNTLRLWDAENGKCLYIFHHHSDRVNSVAFSPDGQKFLSGSLDSTLCLWNITNKKLSTIFKGHGSHVRTIAYSQDGQKILSGSSDKTLRLWDAQNGKCIFTLEGHTDWVASVAYSPNGETMLSGSFDKTLRLWDTQNGKCIYILKGHTSWVNSVTYSPDGQILFSVSRDKTLRLWDIKSGQCLHIIENFSNSLNSVCCNYNGKSFSIASDDGTIKIFNIRTMKITNQMTSIFNQWYSLNYINRTAKGTPLSWKYVSLEHNGEKYYFSDMKGFEVCE
jgi:WD40 repeat protein